MIRDFFLAVSFLSVFSVPEGLKASPENLRRSMAYFPLVGMLIAAVSLVAFEVFAHFLPYRVAVFFLLLTLLLLTGGLHFDGWVDFCDGFFAGKTKEDSLRIMKDPRVGAWGAAGAVLLLLGKFELLVVMREKMFLVFALAAGRWAQVALSYFLPYAREREGLGSVVAQKISKTALIAATSTAVIAAAALGMRGLLVFAAFAALLFIFSRLVQNKFGGITGDVLGAAGEIGECFVLLGGAAWL